MNQAIETNSDNQLEQNKDAIAEVIATA